MQLSVRVLQDLAACTDALLIILAGLLAAWLYESGQVEGWAVSDRPAQQNLYHLALSSVGAIAFVSFGWFTGHYSLRRFSMLSTTLISVLAWAIITSAMLTLSMRLGTQAEAVWHWISVWSPLAFSSLLLLRGLTVWLPRRFAVFECLGRRVALVGATEQAYRVLANIELGGGEPQAQLVGVFDDRTDGTRLSSDLLARLPLRGNVEGLAALAKSEGVDMIMIALPHHAEARIAEIVHRLSHLPADLLLCPDLATWHLANLAGQAAPIKTHCFEIFRQPYRDWAKLLKWLEDKLISLVALTLLAPLFVIIAVLIKLDSPGPVLFRQRRFGVDNEPIQVLKFRTMHQDRGDPTGAKRTVRHDPRVTRIGRILRRTSLDEMPQLINVLRGDMSIVGPRAHPVDMQVDDRLYREAVQCYAARHRVRPGITGLAQVNGFRGEVDTLEKAQRRLNYDLAYIQHWSPLLDLKILVRTFTHVLTSKEAY
jgi:Undecaprenyl-phosphate glucose phosphotransferase